MERRAWKIKLSITTEMLSVCSTYTEDDGRGRGGPGDLDHGEDLRHLTIAGPGVEQSRGGQEDPVHT